MQVLAASNSQTIQLVPFGLYPGTSRRFGLFVLSSTVFENSAEEESLIKDLLIKLDSFGRLQEGWDGYHANPPSQSAIQHAKKFLTDNLGTILPFYFTAPGVNGEVMIECKNGEKAAELYFNPDGTTELLLFINNDLIQETNLEDGHRALFDFFS